MATASDENLQRNHEAPGAAEIDTVKRQRLGNAEPSSRAIKRVFDVEMLLRGLLVLLDLPSLANFLEILAVDDSWREVLTHETLWEEMLTTHFGGKLPAVEQFSDAEGSEGSEGEVDDEEQEEIQEEDVDEGEPDLIELMEGDMEPDDDVSLMGEEEDDEEVVVLGTRTQPNRQSSATQEDALNAVNSTETRQAEFKWIEGVPSQQVLDAACPDLKEFLKSAEQMVQFNSCVQIIRGDIAEIETVGSQRLDGIAFPTASSMRNPHTGAASVIYRRAGRRLTDYVGSLGILLETGDALATPGFDTGMAKLIHCVGPSGFQAYGLRDLQRTYRSVLRCIVEENLSCVAIVSISTGNMGMPVDNAAWFALCAIQRYIRSTNWTATIAIVCFEADVYDAFNKCKAKLLTQFNADTVRAIPPVHNR